MGRHATTSCSLALKQKFGLYTRVRLTIISFLKKAWPIWLTPALQSNTSMRGPPPDHPQRQFHHFSHLLSGQSDNGLPCSPRLARLSQPEICYGWCLASKWGILEPRKGYVIMSAWFAPPFFHLFCCRCNLNLYIFLNIIWIYSVWPQQKNGKKECIDLDAHIFWTIWCVWMNMHRLNPWRFRTHLRLDLYYSICVYSIT